MKPEQTLEGCYDCKLEGFTTVCCEEAKRREDLQECGAFFFEKLRRMWSMTILYLDDANFLLLNVSYIWMKCMCS